MFANPRTWCALAALFAAIPTYGMAGSGNLKGQMELCAATRDVTQRLSCFDGIFQRRVPLKPPAIIKGHGSWIGVRKQLVRGKVKSTMLLPAKGVDPDTVYSSNGAFQADSFIRIDCIADSSSVYLHWPRDLGHREIALDFSFDSGDIDREVWRVTLDGNIVRPKSSEDEKSFLRDIWTSKFLTVSIPRNGLIQQYELTGLHGVSNKMKDVCQWPGTM